MIASKITRSVRERSHRNAIFRHVLLMWVMQRQKPRLVATDGMGDTWAALSYCWGGKSSFVLNKDTSTGLFGGLIPLTEYPQTLQDAIIITRLLSIRYLWIDAICIMQDSHDGLDRRSSTDERRFTAAH